MTSNITGLSQPEAEFLSRQATAGHTIFTAAEAQAFWGEPHATAKALSRLAHNGWLQRLERGVYLLVPLEAGPERTWTESALVIAPHLVQPAAVAYWSALRYWNLTEQVPRTTFVQTTRRKAPVEILGMPFRFVTIVAARFFGVVRRTLDGKPLYVTDREKTLIDAAARPDLSGGVPQLADALRAALPDLDWSRLDEHLERWGAGVVYQRLGYLIETLALPIPGRDTRLARWHSNLSHGISRLDPTLPATGPIVTRWRLRANLDLTKR